MFEPKTKIDPTRSRCLMAGDPLTEFTSDVPLPTAFQRGESDPSWKDTNPKEAFGDQKLPLDVVPSVVEEYAALGFLEGALKYGRFNYRVKGVKVSTYIAALRRHIKKYMEGEWADQKTRVPHLANALACIGIILDVHHCGKLTDDRPPSLPNHSDWIDDQQAIILHLKELYHDMTPRHYTIADTQTVASNVEESCPSK